MRRSRRGRCAWGCGSDEVWFDSALRKTSGRLTMNAWGPGVGVARKTGGSETRPCESAGAVREAGTRPVWIPHDLDRKRPV